MKYSVILPAKNEELNIELCLNTLTKFKLPLEIIVVDNGSIDDTVIVAQKITDNVYVKPEMNLSQLRNFGASVSVGEVIIFLDSDCIPELGWLEAAVRNFEDSGVGAVGCTPYAPENGTWVECLWSRFRTRRTGVFEVEWINSSNLFIRKKVFVEVGGFSEKLTTCEDVDICYRIRNNYKIIYDSEIKVIHLGEPKTILSFFEKERWRGISSFSGVFVHGFSIRELVSLSIPVYHMLMFILVILFCWTDFFLPLIIALCLPSLLFVMKYRRLCYDMFDGFRFFILFLTYSMGRSAALFTSFLNRVKSF